MAKGLKTLLPFLIKGWDMAKITVTTRPSENEFVLEIINEENKSEVYFFTKTETESLVKKLLSALAMVPEDQRKNYVEKAR